MKLFFVSAFALLVSVTFMACGNKATSNSEETTAAETSDSRFTTDQLTSQQQTWDKVMAIHDEVMPKMGTMHQLTKSLKTQWESNESLDTATKDDISIAIQELESADEGMWDWMHNLKQLKPLQESEAHDAIIKYLKDQEQSIILVREEMNNSMAKADSILKALEVE
ncbi:hypothetical protein [Flavilitoribacter nigricans]|uniref:Viral A-type inclusion protein n=1 Tax=Flavilitoribacter nigricans (strain ATCC 23147 / DSM 23189 / NBRC 102662 / NCIMB 1420 / SS-2) TaxID=1122177 RepID=A0A2D0N3X8_FLAN2|nr:hypothetical protein [Flavilitoribacter nigricans]PHN03252.1 hypothetical protein CRP01_28065 [Flavilitoribacter nigricans DSM 23189 = NBRC 102662]